MVIGAPTNFQHLAHVGWDEQQGFQVQNLPAEWKNLFKSAGVTKKDLKNKIPAVSTAAAPIIWSRNVHDGF